MGSRGDPLRYRGAPGLPAGAGGTPAGAEEIILCSWVPMLKRFVSRAPGLVAGSEPSEVSGSPVFQFSPFTTPVPLFPPFPVFPLCPFPPFPLFPLAPLRGLRGALGAEQAFLRSCVRMLIRLDLQAPGQPGRRGVRGGVPEWPEAPQGSPGDSES